MENDTTSTAHQMGHTYVEYSRDYCLYSLVDLYRPKQSYVDKWRAGATRCECRINDKRQRHDVCKDLL